MFLIDITLIRLRKKFMEKQRLLIDPEKKNSITYIFSKSSSKKETYLICILDTLIALRNKKLNISE